jgi:hypothetical protein
VQHLIIVDSYQEMENLLLTTDNEIIGMLRMDEADTYKKSTFSVKVDDKTYKFNGLKC